MLLDLTSSDTSSPLSIGERDLAALAACERGTILLDVAARADATLMELTGTNGGSRCLCAEAASTASRSSGPTARRRRGSRAASNVASSTPRTPWAWTTAAPTRSL